MRVLLIGILLASVPAMVQAQPPPSDPSQQLAKMSKLDFLVGKWEGESWTEMRPGDRHTTHSTEVVESRLGGLVLVIEGVHRDPKTESVDFHALGVLSWDPQEESYLFRSYLADGRSSDSRGHFEDAQFVWSPPTPPGVTIRYRIEHTEEDGWFEVGEMSRGDGAWRQFFEMKLKRVPD